MLSRAKALAPMGDAHPLLVKLAQARGTLAEVRSIDYCKTLRDQAEAVRVYVRQQQLGREAEVYAAEIRVRAERRIGELTMVLPTSPGGRPENPPDSREGLPDEAALPLARAKKDVLAQAGLSTQRASEYEQLAALPEEVFEAQLQAAEAEGSAPTTTGVLRAAATGTPARPRVVEAPPAAPVPFPAACPHCGVESLIQVLCLRPALNSHQLFWVPAEKAEGDWYPEDGA